MRFERRKGRGIQLDHGRNQQLLAGNGLRGLSAQTLKADTFVGGMLINQNQTIARFGDNIAVHRLAQDPQIAEARHAFGMLHRGVVMAAAPAKFRPTRLARPLEGNRLLTSLDRTRWRRTDFVGACLTARRALRVTRQGVFDPPGYVGPVV